MKQLELKHLTSYLPYGLKIELLREEYKGIYTDYSINSYTDYPLSIDISGRVTYGAMISEIKPIIYSWDYLTKPITHNGETFVPIEWLEEKYYTLNYREQCLRLLEEDGENWINQTDYMLVEQLIEWRFDVFNLIENGLAVPVTEDFNPYNQ